MMPFNNPRLFLEHAQNHVISLAIIDVWMPELNGLEVQRLLHNMAPATRVIMMTGRDDPGNGQSRIRSRRSRIFYQTF